MSELQFTDQDWRRFLTSLEEDPDRPGLVETPSRVSKAWKQWTAGYGQDPADFLKVFEDGANEYNELIVVRGIPVYSHCEHHLAPFFGKATIGYVPNGKIVGLSKLTRLVDCFAKRLQVQERLTTQVANALLTHLQPRAVGVVISCLTPAWKAVALALREKKPSHQPCLVSCKPIWRCARNFLLWRGMGNFFNLLIWQLIPSRQPQRITSF